MADYKRMVSYMYQYENGVKRKNVGFAKIEIRAGQCKINLHMQLLGQLDSIFPVYLIRRGDKNLELINLGDAVLKNQIMDSRLMTEENNVMGSGYRLSEMGGILLFLNDNVFYATEWDDIPLDAKEVMEALKPPKNHRTFSDDSEVAPGRFATVAAAVTNEKEDHSKKQKREELKEEKPKEEKPKEEKPKEEKPKEEKPKEEKQEEIGKEEPKPDLPNYMLPGGFKMVERLQTPPPPPLLYHFNIGVNEKPLNHTPENPLPVDYNEEQKLQMPFINNSVFDNIILHNADQEEQESKEELGSENPAEEIDQVDTDKEVQDYISGIIEESANGADGQGAAQSDEEDPFYAKKFFEHYPRIYPFEDNEILQCVKIEPGDLGFLPKEVWQYSNNSFLMHGFYSYHHLIFAKMKDRYGCRYILGIPGIYHSREQFMARMFGFENFKSIRKRELVQGDFGYWYLPIYL